jgi:hypothetical protein
MNDEKLTPRVKKRGRYVSGLLTIHGISQDEVRERLEKKHGIKVSVPFISMLITGRRIGAKEKGKLARQVIAESLGMKVEDLWPRRAA